MVLGWLIGTRTHDGRGTAFWLELKEEGDGSIERCEELRFQANGRRQAGVRMKCGSFSLDREVVRAIEGCEGGQAYI